MFKAALKSLLARKLRLVMSTFAIVLGVSFVAGTLVFTDTLGRSFTSLFASTVGDVVVRPVGTSGGDLTQSTLTLPAELVEDLAEVPGAARVDGNVIANAVYVVDADGKVIGGQGAPGLGGNWTTAPAGHGLPGLGIVQGRAPERAGEVVLDRATADRAGYQVGDQVQIVSAGAQALIEPELVGIADFGENGSLNGASLALFDTETSQEQFLDGQDAFTDLWVTAADGVSQDELLAAVESQLPEGVEALTGDEAADENASQLLEAISFLSTFLLIFAGISLVVGSFLIANTFSILVAQRSRELALFRALGASTRQVTGSVMFEALLLGVLGSTAGLALGIGLAWLLRILFGNFGLDLGGTPMVYAPRTVLAAYAVGIVVTVIAAWLPARRTARIAPVAALRDDIAMPESSLRARLVIGLGVTAVGAAGMVAALVAEVPRSGWVLGLGILLVLLGVAAASPVISKPLLAAARAAYARLGGAIGNLAGQNALRNPRRTAATASALMIGLSLVTTMSILGASAKASVDKVIEESFSGDFVVSSAFGEAFSASIAEEMSAVDGVEAVVRTRFAIAKIDGTDQGISAVDPAGLGAVYSVEMSDGDLDGLEDGAVFVAESYAEDHDLALGSTLAVRMATGEQELAVSGIFPDQSFLGFPLVTTLQTLRDGGYPAQDNFLLLAAADAADRATVQADLESVVAQLPTVTVKDQQAFADEQRGPIDQLLLLIYALLGLALVIAVLGIINTLALSIVERTRELGLLRAIGVSRRQLRLMVTLESVVIAVLGAVLGLGTGLVFGLALMSSLADEGLEVIQVPITQLGVFLALAVLVGILAAVLPARRAARLDVLAAIATE